MGRQHRAMSILLTASLRRFVCSWEARSKRSRLLINLSANCQLVDRSRTAEWTHSRTARGYLKANGCFQPSRSVREGSDDRQEKPLDGDWQLRNSPNEVKPESDERRQPQTATEAKRSRDKLRFLPQGNLCAQMRKRISKSHNIISPPLAAQHDLVLLDQLSFI